MVVSIVQATRIKARIRVRNRQKAALRISRAARLYLGSKNLTSLRRKHAIAAGAKSVARQLRRRAGANAGNASFLQNGGGVRSSACAATRGACRRTSTCSTARRAAAAPWRKTGGDGTGARAEWQRRRDGVVVVVGALDELTRRGAGGQVREARSSQRACRYRSPVT